MSDRPQNLVCPESYAWAFNRLKLNQAYSFLVHAKTVLGQDVNPDDEEQVKDRYIAIKTEEQKANFNQERPKSTSNVDRRPRARAKR